MISIIIIILVITCMQGVYSYVPETYCISRVHIQCCSCSVFIVCVACHVVVVVVVVVAVQAVGQFQSQYTYIVLIYQLINNVYSRSAAL